MELKEFKSYAKVNLFLKIVGVRGNYHELFSRFLRVNSLYDTLYFVEENRGKFHIDGDFNFSQNSNIIYKTLLSLLDRIDNRKRAEIEEFLKTFTLKVDKRIPMMAGLGGGSSNSATFLNMIDRIFGLKLSIEEKIEIVKDLGSDIIFFLYDIDSANVYGTGETIKPFNDNSIASIEVYTPEIECNTGAVYSNFRNSFFNITPIEEVEYLADMSSLEIYRTLSREFANDLFLPALDIYPDLVKHQKDSYLFSGSGSSFFEIRS
jgi:4-diphosphocytidyl-2-C-methyl-D-erythritol kinase